jgi:cytochrome c
MHLPAAFATATVIAALSAGHALAADVERGRKLIAQYQCGTCHAIPGVASARGHVAQDLQGWKHRSYIAGRLPNNAGTLARWIVAPQALVPGTAMPSMGVSPQDAADMAAYLLALE